MEKPKVATVWLEGCSGCHMSFLDLDEGLADILAAVELTVTPITDFKDYDFPEATLGIIEGAVGNTEQLEILHKLRKKCQVLMAWGDCAVFGGVNTLRNHIPTEALLTRGFIQTESTVDGVLPVHQELPALLPQVLAVNEIVPIEIYVPGCPPSPEAIAHALQEVLQGRIQRMPTGLLHFD
ncbi:MAG: NADP oxidoreductase [Deltaproteobacteria bacterium]|nr:NADP oxidoreductase [Deltaproteobacteria bacterium]